MAIQKHLFPPAICRWSRRRPCRYGGRRPAFAQSTMGGGGQTYPATAQPMADPVAKYPKPPFEGQRQEWPGLASKMNPRPRPWRNEL